MVVIPDAGFEDDINWPDATDGCLTAPLKSLDAPLDLRIHGLASQNVTPSPPSHTITKIDC